MEKGYISGFGHLACPLAGGDMGRHRGGRTRRQIDWATRIRRRRGFFGGIGGRSLGDLGTDFWGIGGSFLGDWWQFFWGIGGSFFGGLVAVFFRGEADLRVGWRQFFEKL